LENILFSSVQTDTTFSVVYVHS